MIRERLALNPIMAAADYINLEAALASNAEIVVLMNGKLSQLLEGKLEKFNKIKPIFIHMDLLKGLGSDQETLTFIKNEVKVTGIVSTKNNIIRCGKKLGLSTIQRIFLIDTHSLSNAIDSYKKNKPDAIEIMPGIATSVIPTIREKIDAPIIMSGLISKEDEIKEALSKGADGISMSREELWQWKV